MYKKKASWFLSLLLIVCFSVPIMADEISEDEYNPPVISEETLKEREVTLTVPTEIDEKVTAYVQNERDVWSVISGNVDKDDYGGMYIEDEELHIKTMNSNVETLIDDISLYTPRSVNGFEKNIILDDDAVYSIAQLEAATDRLWTAFRNDEINIVATAIDEKLNGIIVEATEWTNETKTLAEDILGIDSSHLVFETVDGVFDEESENSSAQASLSTRSSLADAMPGSLIHNKDTNRDYTLGAGICYETKNRESLKVTTKYGFLTAAHNCNVDDLFYMGNYKVGAVKFLATAENARNGYGTLDAAVIRETNKTAVNYSLNTYNGKIILNAAGPIQGETAYMIGGISGLKSGKITSVKYEVNWTGDAPGFYRFMVKTTIVSASGDSGAPLLRLNNDGTYTLLGILKGRESSDNMAIFTSWDCLEREFSRSYDKYKYFKIFLWP